MRRKKGHDDHEEHIDETWLIPYADLLTLLLALFIVLFASSQIDAQKLQKISESFAIAFNGGVSLFQDSSIIELPKDVANIKDVHRKNKDNDNEAKEANEKLKELEAKIEQETVQLNELKKKLDLYIDDIGLSTQLETKLNNRQLLIVIRDNALFASASADVKPEAQKLARAIGDMLAQYPSYEVTVAGHTDDRPINTPEFRDNWDLSAKRALNFMKILLETDGIGQERFSSSGYGEFRPIETNETVEGRAANRRVEVSIIRNFLEQEIIQELRSE